MSKLNGRQKKALEGLAAALTECFDAAGRRRRSVPRVVWKQTRRLSERQSAKRIVRRCA